MRSSITLTFILSLIATTALPQHLNWWFDTNDMAFGNSATADIDNDGKLEIVFSCYRNDSMIYALNGEDGSLLWKYNTGGCNDVAPVIHDVDSDGQLEVILPSSCNPTTFCFNGATGAVEWTTPTDGSDSPPTIADIDNDGLLEIIHGEFGGDVICINGEDGSINWDITVDPNSWIQTAPAILDVDQDGQLDFVVANWSFDTAHNIFAYKGDDQTLLWQKSYPDDVMYHGIGFGDIDGDSKPELTIGSYDGYLYVLNAEDGSLEWNYAQNTPIYVGAPTSIADLNNDTKLDVVYIDNSIISAIDDTGSEIWSYNIPGGGSAFRGAAIADIDGNNTLDVTFGTSTGFIYSLDGMTGNVLRQIDLETHYGQDFKIDHGPIIADFNNDDTLDVFVVGGHAEFPDIWNNYGRGYMVSLGKGNGPDWRMFRRDHHRSACLCNDSLLNTTKKFLQTTQINSWVSVYPNPMSTNATVQIYSERAETVVLAITDISGRVVQQIPGVPLQKGSNQYKLKLEDNTCSGLYQLTVSGQTVFEQTGLVIQR